MCRLFGFLTARPDTVEPWLVHSDQSLLRQSNVTPETAQKDGWGIGWYTDGGRPRVEKGVGGAYEPAERELFTRAARTALPPLVIGHLRHASNPLSLPPRELIGLDNSQPFATHAAMFAHNGSIPFPRETRPFLGVHEGEVRGVNDSEVLFRLLLRNTEETGDPLVGYVRSVEDLVRVWQAVGRPAIPPFSAVNVLFAPSPRELWAFCQWTGEHGTGLLDDHRRYYEMAYRATGHQLIIGSEPFDRERGTWHSLTSGTYLHARLRDRKVEVRTDRIPLPTGLEIRPPPA